MPAPHWLIEPGVFGADADRLAAEVRRQGMACGTVTHRELVKGPSPVGPGACVVVYGSYPVVRHAQLHAGWVPGGWLDPVTFDCATYGPHFAPLLLNREHEILRGIDAIRESDRLFAAFGADGEVFARPTGVHKLFVGRRIRRDSWETALAPTRYDPDTTILVARPRPVGREWRFVVVGSAIVSGCRYATDGAKDIAADCSPAAAAFAAAVLAEVAWRPAEVFVLDVCESAGEFRVVELNPFETSGLYGADLEVVVRAVSGAASAAFTAMGRP